MSNPKDKSENNVFAQGLVCSANAVNEVFDFCIQTGQHLDKRRAQAEVIAHGLVVGGIKDIPNELLNHTGETLAKLGSISLISAGLGAALGAKSKWIATGAHCLGWVLGGSAVAATAVELAAKPRLQTALSDVWRNSDEKTMSNGKAIAEIECGPIGFNWELCFPASAVGGIGGRLAMRHWQSTRPNFPGLLNRAELHCSEINDSIKRFVPKATKDDVILLDQFVTRAKTISDQFSITGIRSYSLGQNDQCIRLELKVPGFEDYDPIAEAKMFDIGAVATEIGFNCKPPRIFCAGPDDALYYPNEE
ncbi:MAG: hypothetical protein K2X29_00660 [Candidatus Obscuribacterales bacterium]|nr:hypothetical protein [Candidatus Obscuribacterales bacterium]